MNLPWAIQQLTVHGTTIMQLCLSISEAEAHIKPTTEDWSILEVINHLYDEEREDFRQRIDLILHQPETDWPPIHPGEWVTSRAYQQRELKQSVANFTEERQRSIQWLPTLGEPDWNRSRMHPDGFMLRAGDLLGAWVAHDVLHLRQLVELHYHITSLETRPYSIAYAGDW